MTVLVAGVDEAGRGPLHALRLFAPGMIAYAKQVRMASEQRGRGPLCKPQGIDKAIR
jgi:hypothetical protein